MLFSRKSLLSCREDSGLPLGAKILPRLRNSTRSSHDRCYQQRAHSFLVLHQAQHIRPLPGSRRLVLIKRLPPVFHTSVKGVIARIRSCLCEKQNQKHSPDLQLLPRTHHSFAQWQKVLVTIFYWSSKKKIKIIPTIQCIFKSITCIFPGVSPGQGGWWATVHRITKS